MTQYFWAFSFFCQSLFLLPILLLYLFSGFIATNWSEHSFCSLTWLLPTFLLGSLKYKWQDWQLVFCNQAKPITWDIRVYQHPSTPFHQHLCSFLYLFHGNGPSLCLIWPLRHRATSAKVYMYSVAIAWFAGIAMGVFNFLSTFEILDFVYYAVGLSVVINFCLVTICVSYLSIRKTIQSRNPAVDFANNRKNFEQKRRLSKTLFSVIGVSIAFWAPSVTIYTLGKLCVIVYPDFVNYIITMLHLSNSLANPIIYSLRMPIFMKTFRQLKNKFKIPKRSKKYTVSDENL